MSGVDSSFYSYDQTYDHRPNGSRVPDHCADQSTEFLNSPVKFMKAAPMTGADPEWNRREQERMAQHETVRQALIDKVRSDVP
jgi:hypothetical protein